MYFRIDGINKNAVHVSNRYIKTKQLWCQQSWYLSAWLTYYQAIYHLSCFLLFLSSSMESSLQLINCRSCKIGIIYLLIISLVFFDSKWVIKILAINNRSTLSLHSVQMQGDHLHKTTLPPPKRWINMSKNFDVSLLPNVPRSNIEDFNKKISMKRLLCMHNHAHSVQWGVPMNAQYLPANNTGSSRTIDILGLIQYVWINYMMQQIEL